MVIVLLAGLQVSEIDGAGAWQTFLRLTPAAVQARSHGRADLQDVVVVLDLRLGLRHRRRRTRNIDQRAVLPELAGIVRVYPITVRRSPSHSP
jgi:hypothetical protein